MENESTQSGRTLSVTPRSGATAPPEGEPRMGGTPAGGGAIGGPGPSQTAAQTAPPEGEPSDAEKAKAFRALIRGAYKAQYAEETQKLINRRFRETEALKRRIAELEGAAEATRAGGASPAPTAQKEAVSENAEKETVSENAETETEGRRGGACPSRGSEETPEYAADAAARRVHALAAGQSALWRAQAAALHGREPDFDLDKMRADPTFALLLMHGVPLEQAWRAATVQDRERAAAAAAERALTADIRANGSRPPEAGGGATPAFALRPDVNRLSDGEVREVLQRLAGKERISFG